MISLLVLALISFSIDCQLSDSICSFLLKGERLRDLGLYQFWSSTGRSYRLYNRAVDESQQKMAEEYELEINYTNWKVSAQPSPKFDYYGVHKFYAGYDKLTDSKLCPRFREICAKPLAWNCRIQQSVRIL